MAHHRAHNVSLQALPVTAAAPGSNAARPLATLEEDGWGALSDSSLFPATTASPGASEHIRSTGTANGPVSEWPYEAHRELAVELIEPPSNISPLSDGPL